MFEPSNFVKGITSPADSGTSITPDDNTDLLQSTRALWVGASGDIEVVLFNDTSSIILKNVPSGTMLPLIVKRVRATGTTATDIVGLI